MDIEKVKELALANGFKFKEQADGRMDLNAYVYDFANAIEREVKAQAVPEGFAVVPIEITPKQIEAYMKGKVFPASMGEHRKFVERLSKDYKAMIEAAQEPTPLKVGDLVEPKDYRYILASGACRYPYAYVVNTNPFQLMSEEGDMYWCCTVEVDGYKLLKSNVQLPKGVVDRMIREGLIAPVEAQEQAND